jgi:antitoxin HicB
LNLAVKRQKRLKVTKRRNKHVGSSFDEFLLTEGLYEEVTTLAWKRVLSWEVSEAMRKGRISKSEMAKRMGTSRSQLERLLDPENPHVLLETVQKAATAVGKRLTIGLTDAHARPDAEWWAVLGSNQWPLPCETEVGCLRINDMRAGSPVATAT